MSSGAKDIQLFELKDTILQLNKTISEQNSLILSLQKMLEERNASDAEKDQKIANLQAQVDFLQKKVFGSTSELWKDGIPGQISLFDNPEEEKVPMQMEPEYIEVKGYTKTRKPKAWPAAQPRSARSRVIQKRGSQRLHTMRCLPIFRPRRSLLILLRTNRRSVLSAGQRWSQSGTK